MRVSLLLVLVCSLVLNASAENVTLQATAPEIEYSPLACNASATECNSAWQITVSPDDPTAFVTSTSGPTNSSAAIIPQLYLTFTGTALYIRTSSASTAFANFTLATQSPAFSITTEVDTATANGLITIVGLPADTATTFAVTFVLSQLPTRLEFSNITIVTTGNVSPFSSTLLPSSTTIPSFSPVVSPAVVSHISSKQTRDDIIAEALGAVLGVVLCIIAAAGIVFWRRKRRKPASPMPRDD